MMHPGPSIAALVFALIAVSGAALSQTSISPGARVAASGATASLESFAGVDPTGVTDSTAAIQAALDTGRSLTCNGTYLILVKWGRNRHAE